MILAKNRLATALLAMALITGCQKKEVKEQAQASDPAAETVVNLPIVSVTRENLKNLVNVPGIVSALPDHSVRISPAVAGKLVNVSLVPGQHIHKGQMIARLDNRQLTDQFKQQLAALNTANAGVDQAKTNLLLAQNTAERTKRLVDLNIAAQKDLVLAQSQVETAKAQLHAAKSQVEQAKATREAALTQLGFTEIKSPIDGVVAQRFLNIGDTADTGTPIVQIVDLGTVIVTAYIPVVLPARILPGYVATIKSASLPNEQFSGTVTSVSPVVDAQSANIPVQIRCPNRGEQLKEGMPVTVAITTGVHNDALTIPTSALVADPEAPDSRMVYIVESQKIKRVKVNTGIERDGKVEILTGLRPGESIVEKGAYGLPDGTQIEAQRDQIHKTSAITIPGH
jgi:HlyD family secretion protein